MNTAQKIKSILDRKIELESNISEANRALKHTDMTDLISAWSKHNHRIDVRVRRMVISAALSDQIEADKAELATIDKQLDAIGALMGAGNV